LSRLIRDRLITIRNVPFTMYGMQDRFFNGGQHGYYFTFTIGHGPDPQGATYPPRPTP
jgi:hypothetical protein